jgi:hypothetical protein
MKIPETNLYCTFHTKQFKIKQINKTHTGVLFNQIVKYPIRYAEYATSIDQVPYWRLYIVAERKIYNFNLPKIVRTIVYKSANNYELSEIFSLIKKLGNPNDNYEQHDGQYNIRYHYEAYPRATRKNYT